MKLSQDSIKALGNIVTGDEKLSPYRTGRQLVDLFNEYGANDIYRQDFPTRRTYAVDSLLALNGTQAIAAVTCQVFDPREFMDTEHEVELAIKFFNKWFQYDGYQLTIERGQAKIRDVNGSSVQFLWPYGNGTNDAQAFIAEQIEKAEQKVLTGDYDGAITNARSFLEGIMREIELALDTDAPQKYDGDITKLYNRVKKVLNLEPKRPDIDNKLKQVLSGLISIVSGVATIRNNMSDSHVRSYKPSKHHAVLVVNSVKTLANFLYDTKEYQSLRAK